MMLPLLFLGCVSDTGLTSREIALLDEHRLANADLPFAPGNPVADRDDAVDLGHRLFFDPGISGPLQEASDLGDVGESKRIACVDCHELTAGGADIRSAGTTSIGAKKLGFNAPSLVNAAYRTRWGWRGEATTLWEQNLVPLLKEGVMGNVDPLGIARHVWQAYRVDYEAVFPDAPLPVLLEDAEVWTALTESDQMAVTEVVDNVARVLEAYVRGLEVEPAPFDLWLADPTEPLGADAVRGARLFVGRGFCNECHRGPMFTDEARHNVGAPHPPPWDDQDLPEGAFLTPMLRGVALTAPYMHNGALPDLWEVVEHYNHGGATGTHPGTLDARMQPLHLDDADLADLVAFLETLTSPPFPVERVSDPGAP